MATDDATHSPPQRDYTFELWAESVGFLVLLVLLMAALLLPAFQAAEPYLGFFIMVFAVAVGCRLLVVSKRAEAALRPAPPIRRPPDVPAVHDGPSPG
jgi:hypothetical protein